MLKACTQCSAEFDITDEDLKFYEEAGPTIGGKKFVIPTPTLCPPCRMQRRMSVRNERKLYHTKSCLSGKQIVSMYAPEKEVNVLDQDEWWSDKWDAMDHGKEFDFNKPFFEQFVEMKKVVPHTSLYTKNVENSYFTNYTLNLKSCYLIFGGGNSEDCLYGKFITLGCRDVVDSLSQYECELCYEGIASERCYNCAFLKHCRDCSDCLMIEDCQSCRNCLLCFGLQNKQYCILNEEVGKEKYEQHLQEIYPLTRDTIALLSQKHKELKSNLPHRSSHIYGSENCTGDMILNSKNCNWSFDITNCEESKYLMSTPNTAHSYDCTFGAPDGVRWSYELCSCCGTERSIGCFLCWHCSDVFYSIECSGCTNLFGCMGLKQKHYCIFNKQYSQEQYEELVPKLIAHMQETKEWGEFFPINISSFGYNETIAQEYFPLNKEDVINKNWLWFEEEQAEQKYMGPPFSVPKTIGEVDNDICNQILTCSKTEKPYKIIPQELDFYNRAQLPLPQLCPDQRHAERMERRNPYILWNRTCAKCNKEIMTSYAPDRPETVYCEECYLGEVY